MKKKSRIMPNWDYSFDQFDVECELGSSVKPAIIGGITDKEDTKGKRQKLNEEDNSLYSDYWKKRERLERETHLHIELPSQQSQISFVESSRIWDGRVIAVHETTFTARLVEQSGKLKTRVVEMEKRLVNRSDWDVFFTEGFEFEWVFQRVNSGGTISKRREIRFTPIPHYLECEVQEMVDREMEAFSYLFSDDD